MSPTGDWTAISTWSSKPHKVLTVCIHHSKGSTFVLSYFKTLSISVARDWTHDLLLSTTVEEILKGSLSTSVHCGHLLL